MRLDAAETHLDRPLEVVRRRRDREARRTKSCAAEKEAFSPRIVLPSQTRQVRFAIFLIL